MEAEVDQEHQSLVHIRASEVFPKKTIVKDEESLSLPFKQLPGESVEYLGTTTEGTIALSNYRLFIKTKDSFVNFPIGLIEQVDQRDIFFLYILTKDARQLRIVFPTNETCAEWHKRLTLANSPLKKLDDLYAFAFYAWASEENFHGLAPLDEHRLNIVSEMNRLGFNLTETWRISLINADYRLCKTYPKEVVLPKCFSDKEIESVANFRSYCRIPTVVWRHPINCAVIARCSQPEVGWLGWRNSQDENLLQSIALACSIDRQQRDLKSNKHPLHNNCRYIDSCKEERNHLVEVTRSWESQKPFDLSKEELEKIKDDPRNKVLILDARSYAAAVANRAKGGGCECPEYYPNCEIQFMSLANIHTIRKSYHGVRTLCAAPPDQLTWLSGLDNTKWMHNIAGLMRAALIAVNAVDRDQRPVVVHCSDGWDRTPQIVSLAQLMLDPYYRTIEGFQVLVEWQWVEFGHKFADRCGHSIQSSCTDANERCPVFVQWLDCVHQLIKQFPCSFEFNEAFLVKLVHHTYSCLFGTFLCNSPQERQKESVYERTFSIWSLLRPSRKRFRNQLYYKKEQVLRPSCYLCHLHFWSDVYLPNSVAMRMGEDLKGMATSDGLTGIPKTRSYEDLKEAEHPPLQRRSSDPSMDCHRNNAFISSQDSEDNIQDPRIQIDNENVHFKNVNSNDSSLMPLRRRHQHHQLIVPNPSKANNFNGNVPNHLTNGNVSDDELENIKESNIDSHCDSEKGLGNLSVESSTETITGDVYSGQNNSQDLLHIKSEICLENGIMYEDQFRNNNIINRRKPKLEQCSSISTSTSDISDSHVKHNSHNIPYYPHVPNSQSVHDNIGTGSSVYSSPLQSNTPNSSMPTTPNDDRLSDLLGPRCLTPLGRQLDYDGLITLPDEIQARLFQIERNFQADMTSLTEELQATRRALMAQVCARCQATAQNTQDHVDDLVSLPDSVGSGEQPSMGNGSTAASDVSWEHVEERETRVTLWVPDYAVTHCTDCNIEFWMGRRKHHCRNCGQIFCSDCSRHVAPVPSEQLFDPVRVCVNCFDQLKLSKSKQQLLHITMEDNTITAAAN